MSLAEAKAHLRVLHDEEDAYIGLLLSNAIDACEAYTEVSVSDYDVLCQTTDVAVRLHHPASGVSVSPTVNYTLEVSDYESIILFNFLKGVGVEIAYKVTPIALPLGGFRQAVLLMLGFFWTKREDIGLKNRRAAESLLMSYKGI